MATGSTSDLTERLKAKLAAERALRDANQAFAADLAAGVVRVVITDDGTSAFYRQDNKLREVGNVEIVDVRTAPEPAAGAPTLP